MNRRKTFWIFHFGLVIFYSVMYAAAVFRLNYRLGISISHPEFGIFFIGALIVLGTFFRWRFRKTFTVNMKLKGPRGRRLFRLSVLLLSIHFIGAISTGILLKMGLPLYDYHRQSIWIVPVLLLFHIATRFKNMA